MKHSEPGNILGRILFFYVIASCIIPNIALAITEQYSISGRLTNVILPLGIYTLLMSITKRVGRAGCWMFILMFFAAFQIVLLKLFGRSVIAVDMFLNLVTTNPDEAGELLGNMLPVVALVAVIYLPPLATSITCNRRGITLSRPFLKRGRLAGTAITAIGAATLIAAIIGPGHYRVLNNLYPLNVFDNIYLAVERTIKTSGYEKKSAGFTYAAHSTRPTDEKEIYVAVIGETSRAAQWHTFGYHRNTTAAIDTIAGLTAFPLAISESNTTHKSVPMLMSSLNARTFEDSVYTHKGLITAFREAGFSTMYISNQAHNHSFIDFFGEEADSCIFINTTIIGGQHKFDHDMLPILAKAISSNSSPKQFYVLHCYGSHFSYPDRYPEGTGTFLPDSPVEVTGSNNERLINAYDNTIEYTTRFLADLIRLIQSPGCRAGMIYTSDHGEDIYDDGRGLFLHASPVPSCYQIHVPMLLWLSDGFIAANPEAAAAAGANRGKQVSSSNTYFHTLMEMAGITTPYLDKRASLLSGCYAPESPVYLDDHNEAIDLRDCGLTKEDFDYFSRYGISL